MATGASLDHETTDSYSLTLTATESTSLLTDTATITVSIIDVNDVNPVFTANQDSDTVAEDLAVSTTPIRTFVATGDAGATVTYTITGGNAGNLFAIDGATGALTLASALDFETATSHVLTITATADTQTAALTYTLTVTNVNDQPPVFIAGQDADSVAEDRTPSSTAIRTFMATSPEGNTVSYSIFSGDAGGYFAIDDASGALTQRLALDFETLQSHNLVIRATAGGLTADLSYTLSVTDINDTRVVISGNAAFEVDENITSHVSVNLVDPDSSTLNHSLPSSLTGAPAGDLNMCTEVTDNQYFSYARNGSGIARISPRAPGLDFENPRGVLRSATNTNTYNLCLAVVERHLVNRLLPGCLSRIPFVM